MATDRSDGRDSARSHSLRTYSLSFRILNRGESAADIPLRHHKQFSFKHPLPERGFSVSLVNWTMFCP